MRLALLLLAGCTASELSPKLGAPEQVVPGPGLPSEVMALDANNNLDVIRHEGRVYLAFRTAPSHFASADVVMYVVSSEDERSWRFETKLALGTDLREPRFLSWQGELHLHFAVLGDNPRDFEPGEARRITRDASGAWSAPEKVFVDGFIPWRIKVVNGRPYLSGYTGGDSIYDQERRPIDVHFLTTDDGRSWRPVAGEAVVSRGGGSETDFSFDGEDVIAVIRNEKGDELGWGSKICRNWSCKADPKKYDSPLVFDHDGRIVLVARRTLSNGGRYDLGREDLSPVEATNLYLLDYSEHPKRCAIWEVDPEALKVRFLVDLPSKGDTCFASVLENEDGSYTLYNYTSPLDGPDDGWFISQLGETVIYRLRLEL